MSYFNQPDPRSGKHGSPKRRRRRDVVENDDFAAFARRIVAAHGRRVAAGDVEALADLIRLGADIEAATDDAIAGLRRHGYSWAEIGSRIGISRQAAQQRWGGEH
ncbi:hypothetical protein GCM10009557_13830 [Virgisporangium ochraceum]|uniref:Uncharacterized protein n=1 Tax=Virgisporangium ochraceum TaxID=65505 RepID=A0A8J3ZYL7_9ACTN|nr:hypothetical protein [Virgisporangium ochraceum]GIJ71257.1 hypothetical protein Voc01_061740 [Virgisporangium ochraceum]